VTVHVDDELCAVRRWELDPLPRVVAEQAAVGSAGELTGADPGTLGPQRLGRQVGDDRPTERGRTPNPRCPAHSYFADRGHVRARAYADDLAATRGRHASTRPVRHALRAAVAGELPRRGDHNINLLDLTRPIGFARMKRRFRRPADGVSVERLDPEPGE
jgi:hypothetical protein